MIFIDYMFSKAALLSNTTWAKELRNVCWAAMLLAVSLAV